MQPSEIKDNLTYAGPRWKGDRKVVEIKRHRGQDAVVHYIDQRTHRTGNAPLQKFADGADRVVL